MPPLERFSKLAAIVSLLTITALQLALHPDATAAFRVTAAAALLVGWLAARSAWPLHRVWLLLAPLAPALLLQLTGRQGPIVDIVWMTGLTGSVVGASSWSRWSFPQLWTVLLGGWALVLSLAWPVLVARESGFDAATVLDSGAINSWAMLSAPQVVAWTLYAVQTQLLGLLWFDWIHREFSATPPRFPRAIHALWVGVTISSCVALVQGTIDITFLNTPFWIDERRAAGTMLDANAYGFVAALAGPMGFLALRGDRRWEAAAGIAVLVVNWSGVWMSGSRTGVLCALLGAAGLAIGVVRSRRDVRVIALAGATALVAIIVMSAATASPLQRAARMLSGELDLRSLWSRGGYGTVAMQMVGDYPLGGVGAGAYRYLAPDYWRAIADAQLPLDNAQNWWRHQLAELGLLGGASVLIWSGLVGWRVVSSRARPAHFVEASTVRALLAGIAAVSLVGMPTQNPVALLSFFLLVAWSERALESMSATVPSRWIRASWVAAVLAALAYVSVQAWLAFGALSVVERSKRFRHEYVQGAFPPEPMSGGGEFRWTDDEARFVLPARTRWLVVRLWAHHPDVAEQPVSVELVDACGVVFQTDLRSPKPVAVGITLPPGMTAVDTTVRVSRTWRPADHEESDTRRLGVGVLADFVDDRQLVGAQDYGEEWRPCP